MSFEKSKPTNSVENNPDSLEVQHSPFLPLPDYKGIGLAWDIEARKNILILESFVKYPARDPERHRQLDELLLKEAADSTPEQRKLVIPDNFVTMGQALNDLANAPANVDAQTIGNELFKEVGESLAEVAKTDGLVPTQISYQNFIFSRERNEATPYLLPHIEFSEIAERESVDLQRAVVGLLDSSCHQGADNASQQELVPGWVEAFKEAYRW